MQMEPQHATAVGVDDIVQIIAIDVGREACDALVKGYLTAGGDSSSTSVTAPSDCSKVMSKSECEALLSAQKAAAESPSFSVDECLADPTPACEAVLRPILEQQKAAQQSGQ